MERKDRQSGRGCEPESIEQQLDMCEEGSLRGDESLRMNREQQNFSVDLSEGDREGDEMSGDDHSSGLQGGEASLKTPSHPSTGMPGDEADADAENVPA